MTQSGHETLCQWVSEHIESYLDGDLDPAEQARAKSHLDHCTACSGELELARNIAGSLRALPILECPDRVTEAVYGRVGKATRQRATTRFTWDRFLSPLFWRPAVAVVVTAGLVALIALVSGRREAAPIYSARDLARARVEAKWALSLVNQVTQRTGTRVKEELLDPRVIRPVIRAVETTTRNRGIRRDSQEVRNAG